MKNYSDAILRELERLDRLEHQQRALLHARTGKQWRFSPIRDFKAIQP